MTITVNGLEVLQYEIDEAHANRHFGFFRYADQTETPRAQDRLSRRLAENNFPHWPIKELAYPEHRTHFQSARILVQRF